MLSTVPLWFVVESSKFGSFLVMSIKQLWKCELITCIWITGITCILNRYIMLKFKTIQTVRYTLYKRTNSPQVCHEGENVKIWLVRVKKNPAFSRRTVIISKLYRQCKIRFVLNFTWTRTIPHITPLSNHIFICTCFFWKGRSIVGLSWDKGWYMHFYCKWWPNCSCAWCNFNVFYLNGLILVQHELDLNKLDKSDNRNKLDIY